MELTHRHLLIVVGAVVLATVVGLVALWPPALEVDEQSFDTGQDATITAVEPYQAEPDPFFGDSGRRAVVVLELTDGTQVESDLGLDGYPPLSVGMEVVVIENAYDDGTSDWFIVDIVRGPGLRLLLIVFVGAVLVVGRLQGARSLLGLALSLVVIAQFMLPAILAGSSPFLVALTGAMAILLISVYLAHGFDVKTTTAVVGTVGALIVTIVLGLYFVDAVSLTGYASEEATLVSFEVAGLDLRGLVLAGLVIAALGVLDDVTVTQASTVFALRRAAPTASNARLFREAMVVGRDHIASTVNTLVLAYAGASLALLLVFTINGTEAEAWTTEVVAEEIVKTLVGSMGIIAAVPLTTWLATLVAPRVAAAAGEDAHHH